MCYLYVWTNEAIVSEIKLFYNNPLAAATASSYSYDRFYIKIVINPNPYSLS